MKFKIGDAFEAQGARVVITGTRSDPDFGFVYEIRSPFTKGDPWLVSESMLTPEVFGKHIPAGKKNLLSNIARTSEA